VKAAWANVQSTYQRRNDLIPNLVATVQGYAQQEKSVLVAVTGWKQASDKILANLAGFDHHVAKPYDPNELVKLLAKIRREAR